MGRRIFPPEVLTFFEANNKGKTAQEMTDLLNETFGTNYTAEQIKGCRSRNHWDSGLTGHFAPGHVPHNKGKHHAIPGSERTQFKKGHTPQTYKPVGSETVNKDGYLVRKIADPHTWRMVHVLNWEAVHGPVPKDHVVIFKDRDKRHTDVDNLLLVSRAELAIMNKRGLCTESPKATEAGLALAKYLKAITPLKRKRKRGKIS